MEELPEEDLATRENILTCRSSCNALSHFGQNCAAAKKRYTITVGGYSNSGF